MKPRPRRATARVSEPASEPSLFGDAAPPAPRSAARRRRAPGRLQQEAEHLAISVSTLTNLAREIVEGAFVPLWIRGEVTDFKAHRNGHWYFCLRDASAQVRCVVWSTQQDRIPAPPDEGMQVVAFGRLTVYPSRGDMRFVVSKMAAEGDGLWRKALDLAIARLQADGLLANERKRMLARYPRRVAIVTSPDGAALRDIIAVVRRRCPRVELVVIPAKVQGDGAVEELVSAIERASRWKDCDTLIVGRGGGARDDLWAFNDERVARALASCPIPTISAVGHEVDITLCDLVADLRAPTPSAAAEAAVPVLDDMRAALTSTRLALQSAVERTLLDARARFTRVAREVARTSQASVERRRARLELVSARLDALSPLSTLARGYAVARDGDGNTLSSAKEFAIGERFNLLLRDGQVEARTEDVARRSLAHLDDLEHLEHPDHL
jgi:exodeoxyribonuclease VII large subunit